MGLDPCGNCAGSFQDERRVLRRKKEDVEIRKDFRGQQMLGGVDDNPVVTRSHRLQWGVSMKAGNAPGGLVVRRKAQLPALALTSCPSQLRLL